MKTKTPFRVFEVDKATPAAGEIISVTVPAGKRLVVEAIMIQATTRASWLEARMYRSLSDTSPWPFVKGRTRKDSIHSYVLWTGHMTLFPAEIVKLMVSDATANDVCNAALWGYWEDDV